MPIKIYQSQIRPTEEIPSVPTTPGMRISQEIPTAMGKASSDFLKSVKDFYVEQEKIKSETEVLEKKKKFIMAMIIFQDFLKLKMMHLKWKILMKQINIIKMN